MCYDFRVLLSPIDKSILNLEEIIFLVINLLAVIVPAFVNIHYCVLFILKMLLVV